MKHPYGYAANTVINDKELTFTAKGVYLYLLSKPNEWDFSAHRIANDSASTEHMVSKSLRELEAHGLLQRQKMPSGRVVYHIIDPVTESVVVKTQNPPDQNRPSQNRPSQNRLEGDISKKESSKKENSKKEDILEKVIQGERLPGNGGTPLARISKAYKRLYKSTFGIEPKVYLNGKDGAVLKSLLKDYTEYQVAALLLEYFDANDYQLKEAAYPIAWLSSRVNRLVVSLDKDIDFKDPLQVKETVDESFKSL